MKKKLNKIAKDTNLFLKKFIFNQKKTDLLNPIKYGLLPGGKKIRSKRPPEPFKGKGIRYADEYIIRKEGKKK